MVLMFLRRNAELYGRNLCLTDRSYHFKHGYKSGDIVTYSDKVMNDRIAKCNLSSWDNQARQNPISKTVNPGLSLDSNMGRSVRTRYAVILVVDIKGTTIRCTTVFGSRIHCGSFRNVINIYALTLLVYIQAYSKSKRNPSGIESAFHQATPQRKMKTVSEC
jgi:hypothetical protein